MTELLRQLPRVNDVLALPAVTDLSERLPRDLVLNAVRTVIDRRRQAILGGAGPEVLGDVEQAVCDAVARQLSPSLVPVINGTGVVLHTNLGRAPLNREMLSRACDAAAGYSNLEYKLEARARGSRYDHCASLLAELTGAEDSLVVNNNAAACVLMLSALCSDREVVISRGELIEIGGSFRIPDIMAQSGAHMVEVGATNRTHLRDYAGAITERTAALVKVHRSNFGLVGFTKEVSGAELSELARERGVLALEDLGSGCLVDLSEYGLSTTTVGKQIAAGLDLVTFSGDKLLGGPQAGVLVGSRDVIQRCRKHPLTRAFRVDKLTLATLEQTLISYLDGSWRQELPALAALTASPDELQAKAARFADALTPVCAGRATVTVEPTEGRVGGGALPLASLNGFGVRIAPTTMSADALEKMLRLGRPPIIGRLDDSGLVLDVRTIDSTQLTEVVSCVGGAITS